MNFTVAAEPLTAEAIADLMPLLERNDAETGAPVGGTLEPCAAFYVQAWRDGLYAWHVGRDADGAVVGYCGCFVAPNAHYGMRLEAQQDALFLAPEHRGGMAGARLIRQSDALLREAGVEVIYRQSSPKRDIGPLLRRLGYGAADAVYGRSLNHG